MLRRVQPLPDPGAPRSPVVDHAPTALEADPDQGWALPRSSERQVGPLRVRTNRLGLRGAELAPRLPDEVRLLTVGDSSIYGDGVEEDETFHAVAASELQRAWGRPVSAVNGGVPGYDVAQAGGLVARVGEAVAPDFIVVATQWSDLFGSRQHEGAEGVGRVALTGTLARFATYRVARVLLAPWLSARQVRFAADPSQLGSLDPTDPTRTPLLAYLAGLRSLGDQAEALGAQVVYVALPAPLDLDPVPPPPTVSTFRGAMATAAAEREAPFLDGPALFVDQGAAPDEFLDQVHPGPRAHARLGEALAALLEPQPPPPRGPTEGIRTPWAERGEHAGIAVLELPSELPVEEFLAVLPQLGPVRVALEGQAATGPALSGEAALPPRFLAATPRPDGVLDAWVATDDSGEGQRLGPVESCRESAQAGPRGRRGKARQRGPGGRATWRDLGSVPAHLVLVPPETDAEALVRLLAVLPATTGPTVLRASEPLAEAECGRPSIDSPEALLGAFAP